MNGVLIQSADGPHWGLLELSRDKHLQYSLRHGLDYWCVHGNPAAPKRGGWAKITLLLSVLRMGYQKAIWLDADAVIVRPEHEIACPTGLGMVRHPNPAHWNTGVMVACNEPQVVELLARVEAEPENQHAWMEQHALNQLASEIIRELPAAYNSTPGAVVAPEPVIMAAHGLPMATRRRLMREWLGETALTHRNQFAEYLNEKGLLGEAVEIGVGKGEFSKILLDTWRGRMLHLVDPWRKLDDYQDIANVSDAEQERNHAEMLKRLAPHNSRFRVHRAMSEQAVEWFGDESLDFVYIDANHDTEHVLADLRTWYPKVRPGGLIAGHDYLDGVLPEGNFGVRTAVTRFEIEAGVVAHATSEPWPSWYIKKIASLVPV